MSVKPFDQAEWARLPVIQLLQKAEFLDSAAKSHQYPLDEGYEVAFFGRSNVGKSTCINIMTQKKRLAHTSKTPGRTQLINFFKLSDYQRLVDLPGYGFAQVAMAVKRSWARNIETYLSDRKSLAGAVWLVDSRRSLADQDVVLINWLVAQSIPTQILVAKSDKLSKNQAMKSMTDIKRAIERSIESTDHLHEDLWSLLQIQLFSSTKRQGLMTLSHRIEAWLKLSEPRPQLSTDAVDEGLHQGLHQGIEEDSDDENQNKKSEAGL